MFLPPCWINFPCPESSLSFLSTLCLCLFVREGATHMFILLKLFFLNLIELFLCIFFKFLNSLMKFTFCFILFFVFKFCVLRFVLVISIDKPFYRTDRFGKGNTGLVFHHFGILLWDLHVLTSFTSSKSDMDRAGWGRREAVQVYWA